MPSGKPVGYGPWGVIDAWRRPKPETYIVRNLYSPIKLHVPAPGAAWAPTLTVDNRHDFTDLSEVSFSWQLLESGLSGAGAAAGRPRAVGQTLTLQGLPSPLSGTMQINATSPRGFLINSWAFPLAAAASVEKPRPRGAAAPTVTPLPDGRLMIADAAGAFTWFVTGGGDVSGNTSAGVLLAGGPTLMVLPIRGEDSMQLTEDQDPWPPWNDALVGWSLTSRSYAVVDSAVVVTLNGTYANATGAFTLSFDGDARLHAAYSFEWTDATTHPRQVGLVFSAPADLAQVSWRRLAPYSSYPADHIGRTRGDAVPANVGPVPGAAAPTGAWANDPSPIGDADFRSTRHNVTVFEVGAGARALAFVSDGTQHGRAWIAGDGGVRLLAADLSNEGGNPFSRESILPHPVVARGSVVEGVVTVALGSALGSM